jgi:outer membrane protein assembly factor BamB
MVRVLASTLWPRSAGDAGNRRWFGADGPRAPRLSAPYFLPALRTADPDPSPIDGGVIADDGALRVIHGDCLSSVALDGAVRWSVSVRELDAAIVIPPAPPRADAEDRGERSGVDAALAEAEEGAGRLTRSLPTALAGGHTLLGLTRGAVIVDARGRVVAEVAQELMDDSGPSPCVTAAGVPVLTTIAEGVFAWEPAGLRRLGRFGYDVVPPAVYGDDSLAIAGYAGSGFCRVRLSGEKVWATELAEADLLPTISSSQHAAVGSRNDRCSALYAASGETLGIHPCAAVFAEYPDGGWIAVSDCAVARIDKSARKIWWAEIATSLRWGVLGPIVDPAGMIYVQDGESLVALDPGGTAKFSVWLGKSVGPVFPAGPGRFAVVADGVLRFIG